MNKPEVLVTIQKPLFMDLSTPAARQKLEQLARKLVLNESDTPWGQDEVIRRIGDAEAVIASWGSCTYDERILDAAPNLKIICYAAGSIRRLAPQTVFDRGVRVTHAAQIIAESVAEFTLTVVLTALRRVKDFDAAARAGRWRSASGREGRELYRKRYGIVGASMVGRSLIPLLKPFGVELLVYDPHLSAEAAAELGVQKAELAELMSTCDIISLHAPSTPETKGMINADLIRSIKDNAVFVNNARSWLVDSAALLEELKKERFDAALDVFDKEPLPPGNPYGGLERTLVSPHVAGLTLESRSRLASTMIEELERFLRGEPLKYEVTRSRLATMA